MVPSIYEVQEKISDLWLPPSDESGELTEKDLMG